MKHTKGMSQVPTYWITDLSELLEKLEPILEHHIQLLRGFGNTSDRLLAAILPEIGAQEDRLKQLRQSLLRLKSIPDYGKVKSGWLRVIMDDGTEINHLTAIDTFIEVIEKFGVERVKTVGIREGKKNPLITTTPPEDSNYGLDASGKYYIHRHGTLSSKKRDLERVAEGLGEQITVDIVET